MHCGFNAMTGAPAPALRPVRRAPVASPASSFQACFSLHTWARQDSRRSWSVPDNDDRRTTALTANSPAPAPAPRLPIGILTYHQIFDGVAPPVPHRHYMVTRRAFTRQMTMLHALGWRGLSLTHLEPYLRGELTGKVFGLTFDDGYVNTLTNAAPVLQRLGFSATCYVVSNEVGGINRWDQTEGVAPEALMSCAQLREWQAGGHEIGGHTRNHVALTQVAVSRARNEIAGCKADLENLLGREVPHFCYPYGRFASIHLQLVREAGFRTATTSITRRVFTGAPWFALPRHVVTNDYSFSNVWRRLALGPERLRWLVQPHLETSA